MNALRSFYDAHPLVVLAVIGVAMRLLISPILSHPDDVSMWALNVENMRAGEGLYDVPGYDYLPGWGYVLQLVASMCDLFGIGTLGTRPEDLTILGQLGNYGIVSTVAFNVVLKLPLIATDVLIAFMMYKITGRLGGDEKKKILAFAAWMLLLPAILVTAAYGNFDCICVLFFLISLYLLLEKRYALSGVAMGVSFIIKVFPILAVVPFIFYIFKKEEEKGAIKSATIFVTSVALTIVILLLPQFFEGTLGDALHFITYRLTANGTSSAITEAGMNKIELVLDAGIVLLLFTWLMYRRHGNSEKCLVYTSVLAIGLTIIACDCLQQYLVEVLPLITIACIVYNRRLFWCILLLIAVFLIRMTSDLPRMLCSLAEYTSFISVDTVCDMLRWQIEEGIGHSMYSFMSQYGCRLSQIALAVTFIPLVITRLWKKRV